MRNTLALLIVLMTVASADAGRRCRYRTYQTLYSTSGWNHSCYECHNSKQKQFSWKEAIVKLEATKQDYQAFNEALARVAGTPQTAVLGSYGYAGPYGQQVYSELTQSYAGSTGYGVQGYASSQLVDLNAVIKGHQLLAQQQASGATAIASDVGDVANGVYALENDRQVKIAQLQAIASVGTQPPAQPTSTVFRQQQIITPGTVTAQAEVSTNAEVAGGYDEALVKVVNANCISCHTGQGSGIAKLDLSKQLTKANWKAMVDAVDSGKMPQRPDGSPGEKLSLEERALFGKAWLEAQ